MRITIPAACVGILLAFSLGGCSGEESPSSPSSPRAASAGYTSVSQLKDDAVAAGYSCTNWEVTNQVESAKESGTCYADDAFGIYASTDALQRQVRDYKAQQQVSADSGTQPAAILVGPNWTISGDQDALSVISAKLHAELVAAPAPSTPDVSEPDESQAASPVPVSAALKIGQTFHANSVDITVVSLKGSTNTKLSPDYKIGGALVKSCITSIPADSEYISFTWDPWTAIGPDSEQYPPGNWQTIKTPEYPNDDSKVFGVGDCVKGWIVFDNNGAALSAVKYANSSGDQATWTD